MVKKINILILMFLISAFFYLPSVGLCAEKAKKKYTFTLKDLIRRAIAYSPEINKSKMEILASQMDLQQAKAAYFPRLDVKAIAGPVEDADEPIVRRVGNSNIYKIHDPYNGGIGVFARLDFTLVQPLYTFGKLYNSKQAAMYGVKTQEFEVLKKKVEIALRVKQLYYALIISRQGKHAADDTDSFFNDTKRLIQKLLKMGSENVTQSDIYKVEAYRAGAIRAKAEAEKGAKVAYFALKSMIGLSADEEFDVVKKNLTIDKSQLKDLNYYIQLAFANRPDYKQLKEALEAKKFEVKAEKSNLYPSFFAALTGSIAGAPGREKFDNKYISDEFNHSYAGIIFGMKWDWDFGIKKARIDKKRAEYRRLSFIKENAEMGIPIQIAELYHELKEWQKAAESYHQAAISARKWVVSAMSEFDMGIGTAENLLFGIEKYGDNQGKYLESLYNYHITMAKLEAAIGKVE
ncbi:MAG: hypothetical protein DRG27_00360 [Deltaproteobacteria bacterium]|nr:MAG: hypothetical protein DRG27_00360 [Deltaproteobacteria bacterium]